MTDYAVTQAQFAGSEVDVIALAAVRATHEATIQQGREHLPAIVGVPAAGEILGREKFDGQTEVAMFPGDLPADPETLFSDVDAFHGLTKASAQDADFRFLRLLPPALQIDESGEPSFPHIRLDRALQFLIGSHLQ